MDLIEERVMNLFKLRNELSRVKRELSKVEKHVEVSASATLVVRVDKTLQRLTRVIKEQPEVIITSGFYRSLLAVEVAIPKILSEAGIKLKESPKYYRISSLFKPVWEVLGAGTRNDLEGIHIFKGSKTKEVEVERLGEVVTIVVTDEPGKGLSLPDLAIVDRVIDRLLRIRPLKEVAGNISRNLLSQVELSQEALDKILESPDIKLLVEDDALEQEGEHVPPKRRRRRKGA